MGEKIILERIKCKLAEYKKNNGDWITFGEFRSIVSSIRLRNGDLEPVREYLISLGLPDSATDRIITNITYRFRFVRKDIEKIIRVLEDNGCLERKGFRVKVRV